MGSTRVIAGLGIILFITGCGKFNSVAGGGGNTDPSTGLPNSASSSGSASSSSTPASTPPATPPPAQAAPPASSATSSPPSTPVETTWVYRSDQSLAQFLGGDISLAEHLTSLSSMGVSAQEENRAICKDAIPMSIAVEDSLYRASPGRYNNPAHPLYSGVYNAFRIKKSDLGKALAAGFTEAPGNMAFAVPCANKDSLFIFGQSNAANSGDTADRAPIPHIYMFFNGYCFPAADPLLGASFYSGGESPWMKLARRYAAENPGRDLVLFSVAVGGSPVRDWAPGGALSARLQTALAQARSAGLTVTKIFWHQGESDTIDQTSSAAYVSSAASTFATVRASGFNAPIFIAIGSQMSLRPYKISREIQNAQFSLIEQDSSLNLGLLADFLPEEARSPNDGLHLSTQGLALAGEEWYRRAFVGQDKTREMIRAYYNILMSREPQQVELDYWTSRIASGSLSLTGIRAEFLASDEYFVRGLYLDLAKRQPEKDGYDYWLSQTITRGRATVLAEFEQAARDLTQGGSLFDVIESSLQPKATYWRFDRSLGCWVRR